MFFVFSFTVVFPILPTRTQHYNHPNHVQKVSATNHLLHAKSGSSKIANPTPANRRKQHLPPDAKKPHPLQLLPPQPTFSANRAKDGGFNTKILQRLLGELRAKGVC